MGTNLAVLNDLQNQQPQSVQPKANPQSQAASPQPSQTNPDQIQQGLNTAAQYYNQQLQANQQQPPSGGPVRNMLQRFFSGMGQSMMHEAGLPTPYEMQQRAVTGLQGVANAQGMLALHQQMAAQYAPVPLVGLDGKPITDPTTGRVISLPANHAQTFYAGQLAASSRVQAAQIQAGPIVNTTPDMQSLGLPAQTSLRSANQAQGILQKQAADVPVDDNLRAMFPNLPAGVKSLPSASVIRAMQYMMPQTRSSFQWKETSPGVWEPLPTTSVTTRGAGSSKGATSTGPSSSAPSRPNLPGKVFGGGPIYAFNPQTNETQLTTPQEAQQQGFTNTRKVTQNNIDEDRQLNNRLADVATKISRYDDAVNTPIDVQDRTFMASLLQTDKFKAGLAGIELPVDKFNQLIDAVHQSQLSPAGQNRLISYLNARESMLGYQRVLAGSARSSDQQLNLNLGALPGPIAPDSFTKEGIRQFRENIPIAGRGLPRIPGVPTAGDILSPKVQFTEGNDTYNIPASRVADFKAKHPQAVPSGR